MNVNVNVTGVRGPYPPLALDVEHAASCLGKDVPPALLARALLWFALVMGCGGAGRSGAWRRVIAGEAAGRADGGPSGR